MKKILFFARLPYSDKEIMDGEIQRVKIIDRLAIRDKFERNYIHLTFKSFKNKVFEDDFLPNARLYSLSIINPFSYKKIIRLIKTNAVVYFHSMHNYKFAFLFKFWLKKTFTILDFHGIVPEENYFQNNFFKGFLYDFIERLNIKFFDKYVCVSKSMIDFYKNKYKNLKNEKFELLPMIREEEKELNKEELILIKKKLNIPESYPVIIYSGGSGKWANIEMMVNSIKSCKSEIYFLILSPDTEVFNKLIKKYEITKNIIIKSVDPNELKKYYSISNYGYLLRDDHPLNNVSNPTKYVEYLKYGITPIVLSHNTSDLLSQKVECIKLDSLEFSNLYKKKSKTNIKIFKDFYESKKYFFSNLTKS